MYNSFSGALCKLEKEAHNIILNTVLDDNDKCKYFDELLKQGFIKPLDLNEYNKIVLTDRITILSNPKNALTYVIAPTLACNLNCDYCFESGYRNGKVMSDELLIEIADYILKRTNPDIKEIHIVWFGGEPLIAFNKILKFSEYLIPKLKEMQIKYHSSMISNGVLLTSDRANILAEKCALKRVQITVDGTKRIYCARKHATEKQFDELCENIKSALEYLKISIRLNCDYDNYGDLKAVTKQLIEKCDSNKNLNIYLAKLVDYVGCGGEQFFSQDAFDNTRIEFDKYVCELQGKEYEPPIHKYRKSFCGLFKLNNEVIGPDGELYKCEHHVGQTDKIIGNIKYGKSYNEFLMKFIENEPQEQCKTCKIFPICLGGCPAQKFDLPEYKSCFYSEFY
ncbi:MAG: SPASM domain-containing protein, partial [Malacoplasma sp.]|nr:SPASM domain-containing protein [Malacoplasma sp.]